MDQSLAQFKQSISAMDYPFIDLQDEYLRLLRKEQAIFTTEKSRSTHDYAEFLLRKNAMQAEIQKREAFTAEVQPVAERKIPPKKASSITDTRPLCLDNTRIWWR